MNNFVKKIVFLIIASVCITGSSVNAISERTASVGAVVGGVAVGTATGLYAYSLSESKIASIVAGFITGGISWWLFDAWFFSLTPRGRIKAAKEIVRSIENDQFIMRSFTTSDELVTYVNLRYGTSWPLVCMFNEGKKLAEGIEKIIYLMGLVYQEIGYNDSFGMLMDCRGLEARALELRLVLEAKMAFISNHRDYNFQVGLYAKHQEAELKRKHEAELQERARSHERWQRYLDRENEKEEKEKDRRLKQQALNMAHYNHSSINVNI